MCGDIHCGSCGPAQGHGSCEECGWCGCDGTDHVTEAKCNEESIKRYEELAEEYKREEELAEEYRNEKYGCCSLEELVEEYKRLEIELPQYLKDKIKQKENNYGITSL